MLCFPARGVRWALIVAIAISGAGCAAPTLPLPPPTALVEGPPDADSLVTVRGQARAGSFVGCINQRTEDGVIVRADVDTGAYVVRIVAESGDALSLWQFEASNAGGQQVDVFVPEP